MATAVRTPHVKPGLQSGITPNPTLCLPCAEDYSTQNLHTDLLVDAHS